MKTPKREKSVAEIFWTALVFFVVATLMVHALDSILHEVQ